MFIYENSTSTAILCDSALYAVWLLAVISFKPFNNQLDLFRQFSELEICAQHSHTWNWLRNGWRNIGDAIICSRLYGLGNEPCAINRDLEMLWSEAERERRKKIASIKPVIWISFHILIEPIDSKQNWNSFRSFVHLVWCVCLLLAKINHMITNRSGYQFEMQNTYAIRFMIH